MPLVHSFCSADWPRKEKRDRSFLLHEEQKTRREERSVQCRPEKAALRVSSKRDPILQPRLFCVTFQVSFTLDLAMHCATREEQRERERERTREKQNREESGVQSSEGLRELGVRTTRATPTTCLSIDHKQALEGAREAKTQANQRKPV